MKFLFFSIVLCMTVNVSAKDWMSENLKCIEKLKNNKYAFGDSILDCEKGIAQLDCSGFINNIMAKEFPNLYQEILKNIKGNRPNVSQYYNYFSESKKNSKPLFNLIGDLRNLKSGNLLMWKYSESYRLQHKTKSTGHIMFVISPAEKDLTAHLIYKIKVMDSALSGHNQDTRKENISGLGSGDIWLKVSDNFSPKEFSWSGRKWQNSQEILLVNLLN